MLDIHIAVRSDIGKRGTNEDRLASGRTPALWYALVADGAGGHVDGEEASRRAIARLEEATRATAAPLTAADLDRAVIEAHRELQRQQVGAAGSGRMHSTIVALWIDAEAETALWSHVGDSRLYRVRHGVADLLTTDDSVVQRMVEGGMLTAEQARAHPRKNQLLSALGIEDEVEPHTLPEPAPLRDGDAFLLCTDGWWECFAVNDVCDAMRIAASPEEWLEAMQRRIVDADLPRQDNYSAVAVWVGDPTESTRFMDDTLPPA